MSSPTIVTCLLGIYFFLAGCLQIALHVSTVPTDPFPPFLSGLLVASWPLGVAGVIFILLDIKNQLSINYYRTPAPREIDEPEIPEEPVHHQKHTGRDAAQHSTPEQERVSYFNVDLPATEVPQPPAPAVPAAQPPQQAQSSSIFATPPPFQQQKQQPPPAATLQTTSPIGVPGYPSPAAAVATPAPKPPPAYSPAGVTVPLEGAGTAAPNTAPKPQNTTKPQEDLSFFKI